MIPIASVAFRPRIIFAICPAVVKVNTKGLAFVFSRSDTSVALSVASTAESVGSVAGWMASLVTSADLLAARRESTLLIKYELMVLSASGFPRRVDERRWERGRGLAERVVGQLPQHPGVPAGLGKGLSAAGKLVPLDETVSCIPFLAESLRFIISRVSLMR
jgi:hypothetical protein